MGMTKEEVDALEALVDITTNVGKLQYANEVMSSMLAKISITVRDDDLTTPDMVEKILLLLEWYDIYQAGGMDADITGSKLGEKK